MRRQRLGKLPPRQRSDAHPCNTGGGSRLLARWTMHVSSTAGSAAKCALERYRTLYRAQHGVNFQDLPAARGDRTQGLHVLPIERSGAPSIGRIQLTASASFCGVQMPKPLPNFVSANRTGSRAGAAQQSESLTRGDEPKPLQAWAGDGSWSPAREPVRRQGLVGVRSGDRVRDGFLCECEHPASHR